MLRKNGSRKPGFVITLPEDARRRVVEWLGL